MFSILSIIILSSQFAAAESLDLFKIVKATYKCVSSDPQYTYSATLKHISNRWDDFDYYSLKGQLWGTDRSFEKRFYTKKGSPSDHDGKFWYYFESLEYSFLSNNLLMEKDFNEEGGDIIYRYDTGYGSLFNSPSSYVPFSCSRM